MRLYRRGGAREGMEMAGHPPSSCVSNGSSLSGSGSLVNLGMSGGTGVSPVLVKAPDLRMNSARAEMPSLVPRMVERASPRETFVRMFRCRSYLGQSLMMWFLDSTVSLSQGHVDGSGESGINERRNSPV